MNNQFNKTLDNYYYGEQFKKYIIQFMQIFTGLKVSVGKNDFNSEANLANVNVKYGSMDRVVAHVKTEGTQNKPMRLPIISCQMVGVELAEDARVGVNTEMRTSTLPRGGTVQEDLIHIYQLRPTAYRIRMEVALLASNTDQHIQMLEQILLLFNPQLKIYTSDDAYDWGKLNEVFLDSVSMDENYPAEDSPRIISSTMQMNFLCYLQPPAKLIDKYIKSIRLRIDLVSQQDDVNEVASDVDRPSPPYETIIDIFDMDDPPPEN